MIERLYNVKELTPYIREYTSIISDFNRLDAKSDSKDMTHDEFVRYKKLVKKAKKFEKKCEKYHNNLFNQCFKDGLEKLLNYD